MAGEQKVLYAVVTGAYSDYEVHAVFEREEDAKVHAATLPDSWGDDDHADVTELPYFTAGQVPGVVTTWMTHADGDGPIEAWSNTVAEYEADDGDVPPQRPRVHVRGGPPDVWRYSAHGASREACVKAIADFRAAKQAERAGIV